MLNLLFSSMFTRFLLGFCSVSARVQYETITSQTTIVAGVFASSKGLIKQAEIPVYLIHLYSLTKKRPPIWLRFLGEQLALHFSLDKLFPTLWWGCLDSRCHIVAVIDSVMTADKRIINKGKTEFTCGGGWFSQGCRQRWHSQGHRGLRQRQHRWCYVPRCVCSRVG